MDTTRKTLGWPFLVVAVAVSSVVGGIIGSRLGGIHSAGSPSPAPMPAAKPEPAPVLPPPPAIDLEAERKQQEAAKLREQEELRQIAPRVIAYGDKNFLAGFTIVEARRLDDQGSWVFLVRTNAGINPKSGDYVASDYATIFVRNEEPISDMSKAYPFWWMTLTAKDVAARIAAAEADTPGETFLVERAEASKDGKMDAIVSSRQTGKRYNLKVENYSYADMILLTE